MATESLPPLFDLQLNWTAAGLAEMAASCNGCGRPVAGDRLVNVPDLRAARRPKEASPRAKANLMAGLLTGQFERKKVEIQTSEFKGGRRTRAFTATKCRSENVRPASIFLLLMLEGWRALWASHGLTFSGIGSSPASIGLVPWQLADLPAGQPLAERITRPLAR